MSDPKKRVVLGVSGASGAAITLRIGELLAGLPSVELHLIDLCDHHHPVEDIGAAIASGSFRTAGMVVAPCSMRTLAGIATGLADNLLIRAADVHLKERRPLILLARETPLHLGHLRNMVSVTEMGATVMPPVPAFYHRPESVADIVDHIARRAIDLLHLEALPLAGEWQG